MADTETYTVTKRAGPRVAGRPAKAGQELQLTEAQARAEVLSGAIVKRGKSDGDDKDRKDATDPLQGSEELPHIQARARGLDAAPPAEDAPEGAKSGRAAKASGGAKAAPTAAEPVPATDA